MKMLTKQEILEGLDQNAEQFKEYGVRRLGLFGPYIRDEQKSKSGIDVLVEFERGMKTFDNYMELRFFLEELLECKVDLLIYDALKPRLKSSIMRDVEYAKGIQGIS